MKSKRLKSVVKPLLCAAVSLSPFLPSSFPSFSLPPPSSVYSLEWFNAVPSIRTYDHLSPLPSRSPHLSRCCISLSVSFPPACFVLCLYFPLRPTILVALVRSFVPPSYLLPPSNGFLRPSSLHPSFCSSFVLFFPYSVSLPYCFPCFFLSLSPYIFFLSFLLSFLFLLSFFRRCSFASFFPFFHSFLPDSLFTCFFLPTSYNQRFFS